MRALVDDVLASGIEVSIVAEIAHRTSILPMVLNGLGRAVMPASWTESARRSGARVQTITPESYLHVAAVSRRDASHHAGERADDGSPRLRRASRDATSLTFATECFTDAGGVGSVLACDQFPTRNRSPARLPPVRFTRHLDGNSDG